MRLKFLAACCLCAALSSGPARAGIYADALGQCARGATSTEDRVALMRWSFIAATANPRLADLASVSAEARERSFRAAGQIFNRIMLRACRREAIAALRNEGGPGVQRGFQALGELAGREMMLAPETLAVIAQIDRYLDREGLEALGREAAATPPI
jgi:hypothetical protein